MFQILIAILVVILVVLVAVVWYQQRAVKEINELKSVSEQLAKRKIGDQLAAAEKLQLVGDSKDQLVALQKDYQKLEPKIKKLVDQGSELLAAVKTSQLLTINSGISDYRMAIGQASDQADKLQKSLQALQHQEKEHHQAIDQIKQRYHHFHHVLDEKGFAFGDTVKELNDRLAELEGRYAKFTDLTNAGDLEAAQEILLELQEGNKRFANLLEQVPKLYKPLATEYPDQLTELKNGYRILNEQHFNFTEHDLDKKIDQLQVKLGETIKQLNDLQVDVVAQSNKDLSTEIDNLYGVMQKEIDAKPEANHLMKVMGEFISHAQRQNQALTTELQRLNLSYTFNNNEIESARHLDEQIKSIAKDYHRDAQSIEDHTAIYSQIVDTEKTNQKELTTVEEEQTKINDEVAKLQTDEQRARKMLQKYSVDIRTIKRQVEQLNLPGVSQDYLDYFMGVSDEIKKLAAELHEYKINMDDVTKQLIMVESDLESLQGKTSDLRDSAELTERLLQYANRFADNEKIDQAAQEARKLFNEYKYTKSLEKIGTALEEVEPGSFKRIEDSYYTENH